MPVTQRIPAGQVATLLEPGTAARIFIGAPVPEGADAVVMQEMCEPVDNGKGDNGKGDNWVIINTLVKTGSNVRRAGEDINKDSAVLTSGQRLRPQELGLLASVGLAECKVKRKLRVVTFFTGDEIITPGQPLA